MGVVCLLGCVPATALAVTPRPIVRPSISGSAQPGTTLTVNRGTWASATSTAYAYQWRRCDAKGLRCSAIKGALGRAWDVFGEDRGRTFRVSVVARNKSGPRTAVTAATRVVRATPSAVGPGPAMSVAAVGDIACSPAQNTVAPTSCQQASTAALVGRSGAGTVLALGDIQYECGDPDDFSSFDAAWGPLKPIIRPVPGNHEYQNKGGLEDPRSCAGSVVPPGAGYFGYFGAAAGTPDAGYYSFDVGAWHLVALNSNCPFVACSKGSPQEQWLQADLAATQQPCVLAFWHHPRFVASGPLEDRAVTDTQALWADLQAARADVVLNGHVHRYERFAPMSSNGRRLASGPREFIVGTGGRNHHAAGFLPRTNAEVQSANSFGALVLKLGSRGYGWQFVSTDGRFSDRGSDTCQS